MPIGRPLPRYEAHVLDEQMTELPAGETGQLYLAGPALAEGYLNRSDLTEAVFIHAELDGQLRRLYKTGDLARWLPDGTLDFGGRIDHQIKLGSYRVEPGEIESAINTYSGIHESLIRYDEVDGRKYLIAYVATGKPAGGNARDAQEMLATALAAHLREMLPAYMIPTRYVFVDAFPKTINGKIDRESLPGSDSACVARDSHYDAPQNERQHYLAGLWQDVLNLPQVGIHDDFFLLGGSSLLVTRVVARVATDLGVVLPVRDFFANPTVATLSNHLNALLSGSNDIQHVDERYSTSILDRLPIVKPLFIDSADGRLYAVHYQSRSVRNEHAILIAHSLGHEYTRGHRNLQQLAVALCGRGFDVIRFDYLGTGDSEGLCEEVNAETMGRDLMSVRRYIIDQTHVRKVSLVGLRVGATVATHFRDAFRYMVLWDPVPSGRFFLELLDRFHLHALTAEIRFNRIRTDTDEKQRYGLRMNERKRASFTELKINASAQGCDIVLSKDEADPVYDDMAANNRIHRVGDEIIWNDPLFAESAFSSPEAFRVITDLFEEITP
jgi:pimeloyl-ACP methyl ester carboxylesterase